MRSGEKQRKCAVILPVHNERDSLPVVMMDLSASLSRLRNWDCRVICVDDGSTDGSAQWLKRQTDIALFQHRSRRGYGASLKTAIEHDDSEWICVMDADSSYPASAIPELLEQLDRGAVMVVGQRTGSGMRESIPKRLARLWLRLLTRIVTGVWVKDLNSGLRVFHRDLYKMSRQLLPDGFSFTSTLTVVCLLKRLPLIEYAVDYRPRIGISHIRPVPDFRKFCALILKAQWQLRRQ